MKIEQNELEFNDGWAYVQLQSGHIAMPAPEVIPYGKRKIQTDCAYKAKGHYLFDNEKSEKIKLSEASQEWIKEKFEEYQNKHL